MPLVATGMDLEESYINKLASQGKTIVYYLPSMQDEKKSSKGTDLQHKKRLWELKHNVPLTQKSKGHELEIRG